jgi:hypothetical protein
VGITVERAEISLCHRFILLLPPRRTRLATEKLAQASLRFGFGLNTNSELETAIRD